MLFALLILAQLPPADPISGGAGWVGTGLLGSVLAWVFFWHLPAKDKQLEKLITDKDAHVATLTERYEKKLERVTLAFEAELDKSKIEFKAALDQVLNHCDKETNKLVEAFRTELARSAGCKT